MGRRLPALGTASIRYDPDRPLLPDCFIDFRCRAPRHPARRRRGAALGRPQLAAWMLSRSSSTASRARCSPLPGDRGGRSSSTASSTARPRSSTRGATSRSSTATSTTKLEKLYQINDNLFVIIDALMSDSRWDMKFLGMQIMVEGLALGAFGTLYDDHAGAAAQGAAQDGDPGRGAPRPLRRPARCATTSGTSSASRSGASARTGPSRWRSSCATASCRTRSTRSGSSR